MLSNVRLRLGAQLLQAFAAPLRGPVTSQCDPTVLAELEVIAEGKSGPTQLIPARGQGEGRGLRLRDTQHPLLSVLASSDLGRA